MNRRAHKGGRKKGPTRAAVWIPLLLGAVAIAGWILLAPTEPEAAADDGSAPQAAPTTYRAEILSRVSHDPEAYTQGLEFAGDELLESTGLYGRSSLRRYSPFEPGGAVARVELPRELFGEGVTKVGDRILQLTWREGTALVYDAETLREIDRKSYQGEGWGICFDGSVLFMSDGSERLQRRDPHTFAPLGELTVTAPWPIEGLNELECAEGWVWANVYGSEHVVQIDPVSGRVHGVVDLSALLTAGERARAEVLNGIAYHPKRQSFFVTGKNWPALFEVRLVAAGR